MSEQLLLALLVVLCLAACGRQDEEIARQLTQGGEPRRGSLAIERYGCGACHQIPGIEGANALVGPSLAGIADRAYLRGQVTNQPANLMLWIADPQRVVPGTAMPDLNVPEEDARDIAAYLYTLHAD